MGVQNPVKRVVVCVDGTWYNKDGYAKTRDSNNSNVFRTWAAIKQGTFVDGERATKQIALYESATDPQGEPLNKFNDEMSQDGCSAQIDRIFEHICSELTESHDELWLYGFSRGAFVAHEIAEYIHSLRNLDLSSLTTYEKGLQGLNAFADVEHRRKAAVKLYDYLRSRLGQTVIKFMGLFEATKASKKWECLSSVENFRHAVGLNENRRGLQPSLAGPIDAPQELQYHNRTSIEAWFIGTHADLGGGSRDDGLSLYPLQWILTESHAKGLIFDNKSHERNASIIEDPYGLVFPKYMARDASNSHPTSERPGPVKPWTFKYTNGIEVSMVDLRITHRHGNIRIRRSNSHNASCPGNGDGGSITSRRTLSFRPKSQSSLPPPSSLKPEKKKSSGLKGFFTRKGRSKDALSETGSTASLEAPSVESFDTAEAGGPRPHAVRLNYPPNMRSLFSVSRVPFKVGYLIGWFPDVAAGTVVHPSVFFISDIYSRLGVSDALSLYIDDLEKYRSGAFVRQGGGRGAQGLDPWVAETEFAAIGRDKLKDCRVLVCGRAGVGKSTLINKVFGVAVTQESSDEHGVHDIDEGFARDTFPGLIVHDSRGFQSGALEEVELLEKFIKKRSSEADESERLDAIWLCIDVPSTRTIHEADKKIFEVLDKYAKSTPIIIVRTMKDRFINEHLSEAREDLKHAGLRGDELDRRADEEVKKKFEKVQEDDINRLENVLGVSRDFAPFVYVDKRDGSSIRELVKKTISLMPDDGACMNLVAAQLVDVDEKINMAVEESVRLLGVSNWSTITGSAFVFGSTIATPTISRILCKNLCGCFGIQNLDVEEVEKLLSEILWSNMKKFLRTNITQVLLMWASVAALTATTMFGGIPVLASIPIAGVAPAARMILKCSCDLILILTSIFDQKDHEIQQADFPAALAQYTAESTNPDSNELPIRTDVHREIDALIPIHNLKIFEGLKIAQIRREIQRIIRRYRFVLGEEGRGCMSPSSPSFRSPVASPVSSTAAAELPASAPADSMAQDMHSLEYYNKANLEGTNSPSLPTYSTTEQVHHKAAEVGGLDNQVSLGYRTLNDPLHPTELPDRTYPHNLPVELPLTTVRGSHENRAELA